MIGKVSWRALFVSIGLLFAVQACALTPPADVVEWNVSVGSDSAVQTMATGNLIVLATTTYVAGYDARTGEIRWKTTEAFGPFEIGGDVIYATALGTSKLERMSLRALALDSGKVLWTRANVLGAFAADETGVVVGDTDLAAYRRDGSLLWRNSATGGAFDRIVLSGSHILGLSRRSGAVLHGEIDSANRKSGKIIGTTPWFGKLLEVHDRDAVAPSNFPSDFSYWCTYLDVLDVPLDYADRNGNLASERAHYVLDPVDALNPNPCNGSRGDQPTPFLTDDLAFISSGSTLGVFDRADPSKELARYSGIKIVGGPFAGALFVSQAGVLEALRASDHRLDKIPILSGTQIGISLAGLGHRLYVSDGFSVRAFDSVTYREVARNDVRCPSISAVGRTTSSDVLMCSQRGAFDNTLMIAFLRADERG